MKKIVLTYGLIAGGIMALMLVISGGFKEKLMYSDYGELIGYTTMLLSFTLIFFGIRTYREQKSGLVSFGRAIGIGMLITLVSCVIYSIAWMFVYHYMMPDFVEKMIAHYAVEMKKSGASVQEMAAKSKEMAVYADMYKKPVLLFLITFIEPLPVGIIITFISALILKKKTPAVR